MGVRDYIQAEMGRTPSGIDINVLASNVLRSIPRDEMPTIVHELMVRTIRAENMAHGGFAAMSMAPVRHPQPARPAARPGGVGKSKWEVCLPAWRQMLDRTQMIDGKPYRLGDMTADMLRQAATCRRKQASTMVRNAEWYEKVAAALEEHGKGKVDDLPDDVLAALHEAVAA